MLLIGLASNDGLEGQHRVARFKNGGFALRAGNEHAVDGGSYLLIVDTLRAEQRGQRQAGWAVQGEVVEVQRT